MARSRKMWDVANKKVITYQSVYDSAIYIPSKYLIIYIDSSDGHIYTSSSGGSDVTQVYTAQGYKPSDYKDGGSQSSGGSGGQPGNPYDAIMWAKSDLFPCIQNIMRKGSGSIGGKTCTGKKYSDFNSVSDARAAVEGLIAQLISELKPGYKNYAADIRSTVNSGLKWSWRESPQLFDWDGKLTSDTMSELNRIMSSASGDKSVAWPQFQRYCKNHADGLDGEHTVAVAKKQTIFKDYPTNGNTKPSSGTVTTPPVTEASKNESTEIPVPVPAEEDRSAPRIVTSITPNSDKLADSILKHLASNSVPEFNLPHINGSAVQKFLHLEKSDESQEPAYGINQAITRKSGQEVTTYDIEKQYPHVVQNHDNYGTDTRLSYPKLRAKRSNGTYVYDYATNIDTDLLPDGTPVNADMEFLHKALNINLDNRNTLYKKYTEFYNRYKLEHNNDRLAKTVGHVFFVRPDCNIFRRGSSGASPNPELERNVRQLSEFYYALKHNPEMLRQLTQEEAGYDHEFMMYLSNKARSFDIKDEYIRSETYGQALTGYKVPYGKHDVESKTSDTFSIKYRDDRDLHIYSLHKLWVEYISYVYRGKLMPKKEYNIHKIIDYATCVYYFLCAEDGETVIFWSKYWGVFPLECPSSAFSFSLENANSNADPEFSIPYQYAWKEDFNPLSIIEFNQHSKKSLDYVPIFNKNTLGPGNTWVGAPFIETFNNSNFDLPYTFRLRFRPSGI